MFAKKDTLRVELLPNYPQGWRWKHNSTCWEKCQLGWLGKSLQKSYCQMHTVCKTFCTVEKRDLQYLLNKQHAASRT